MGFAANGLSNAILRLGMLSTAVSEGAELGLRLREALGEPSGRPERLTALLGASENQRKLFAVLRQFAPNVVVGKKLVTAYPNEGTAVVTRAADVVEVLAREADFEVVYEPKMRKLTDGANFFLGMQDSIEYARDVNAMRLAMRRDDLSSIVLPLVQGRAAAAVAGAGGRMEVVGALAGHLPWSIAAEYFGTPGPSERAMVEWTTRMFWYLFVDLKGEDSVETPALAAAGELRDWLDGAIAARKAGTDGRGNAEDVLARCLTLQGAGVPGMDDLGIRNNMLGLVIGLVPTLSKAATQAAAQLLSRPSKLAAAQAAAMADDDATFAAFVFEAMRFDPVNPVIYRRAVRDVTIAEGTGRAAAIPKGTMVLASNLSAMFDPAVVDEPETFRTDRPWRNYMLWGSGMHTCFGEHINRAVIPQMLKPLFKQPGLRLAEGGALDRGGTPFPVRMTVEWDA